MKKVLRTIDLISSSGVYVVRVDDVRSITNTLATHNDFSTVDGNEIPKGDYLLATFEVLIPIPE